MANQVGNVEFWNEKGPLWVRLSELINSAAKPFGAAAMEALELRENERVLDVGCGTGSTTRELAARVGPMGSVVGVDVSKPMLESARELSKGLPTVRYEEADAQTTDLGQFDTVFSRFGVMFFDDPAEAFRNLHRTGARIGFATWQDMALQHWTVAPIMAAASVLGPPPEPDFDAPGPFSLAEPDKTSKLLTEAGFSNVSIESFVQEMVFSGTPEDVFELMIEMGPVKQMGEGKTEAEIEQAQTAILETLKSFKRDDTVAAPAAAWIVTASA